MAPPHDNRDQEDVKAPSADEVERAYETACRLSKEPFRLSQEERHRITSGVLRTMGLE